MSNKAEIFKRILQFSNFKGFKNLSEFSNHVGFASAEKLYRLGRSLKNKPSYDMLVQISNVFEDLNLNWLIKGTGEMLVENSPKNETAVNPLVDSITHLIQTIAATNDPALGENIELLKKQLYRISENEKEMRVKIDYIYEALLKAELSEGIQKTIDKIKD